MNRRYIILLLTTFGGCYLYRNYLKGTEENTFTSIKEYPEPLNNIKEIPDKATLQIKLFSVHLSNLSFFSSFNNLFFLLFFQR